jgi:hypothetical protein
MCRYKVINKIRGRSERSGRNYEDTVQVLYENGDEFLCS